MANENPIESYMKQYGVKLENNEFTYQDSTGNKNVWDFEKNCWVKKMAPCPPPPPPCPPPPPPCPPPPPPPCPPPPPPPCPPPPPPACPPPPPPACPPPPPPACPLPPPPRPSCPPPLPPNFEFDGTNYIYKDPVSSGTFLWSTDTEKWYLQVDDNFTTKFKLNKGAGNAGPSWFEMDDEHNTKVYVSNLPLDITEEEFVALMQKCGLVMKDINSNKWKVKLYRDKETNNLKGDALCTYIKKESVDLALTVLDGSDFRGNTIVVERAKFEMKGEYNPALKPKKRRRKDKEKEKKMIDRLFEWKPEKLRGEREKHERTVIIKNLFEPSVFDNNMELILEYTQDLREECSKCGVIKKLILHDKHPEGVAQVTFSDAEEADLCIKLLNNRWFSQRRITAEVWDGKTKYKIIENESEEKERLENWNKFLEANEGQEGESGKGEGEK